MSHPSLALHYLMQNSGVWTAFYFSPFQVAVPSPAKLCIWNLHSFLFNPLRIPSMASKFLSHQLWIPLVGCPDTWGKSGPTHPPYHNSSPWPNCQAALSLLQVVMLPVVLFCLFSLRLLTANVSFSLLFYWKTPQLPRWLLWLFTPSFPCPRGGCGQSRCPSCGPLLYFLLEM